MSIRFLWTILMIATLSNIQAQTLEQFFDQSDAFFKQYVRENKVDYAAVHQSPEALQTMVDFIAKADPESYTPNQRKAFGINAYNLLVIKNVVDNYPLESPLKISGFFDGIKVEVAGKKTTLNNYEKKELLQRYNDGRLHFVLVCAAVSCPPLANFAYRPETLEDQLEAQTKAAINNQYFIRVDDFAGTVELSKIFDWYAADFKPTPVAFINKYRVKPLPEAKPNYYTYDWTLNSLKPASNSMPESDATNTDFAPIIAAATMPANTFELNTFHTIYTTNYGDVSNGNRGSYFTSLWMFSYGITGRFDVGLDFIAKSFRANDTYSSSPFRALSFRKNTEETKTPGGTILQTVSDWGLTHLGPRVRFSPFKKIGLSFEQAFYLPLTGIPARNEVDPSIYWVTQVYYDKQFNSKYGLFIALTFWQPFQLEKRFNFQVPYLRAFFSWYTTPRFTLYATTMALTEWGVGAKFLITPQFEIQGLYSYYVPIPGLTEIYTGPGALNTMTFNIGIRYRTTIVTKS